MSAIYDLDAAPRDLLTTGNPKTAKGEGLGYLTAVMHLAPAALSGRNVCPHATAGCRAACLNTAGRGGIALDADGLNGIQAARIRRTRFWQRDRAGFLAQLEAELVRHCARAARHGLEPAVRLNGTSDLPWETLAPGLFARFPDVRFYDYTKWPLHLRKIGGIANYELTFSSSEHPKSDERASAYLTAGHRVATVFATRRGGELPATYLGAPVIDGDAHDLRFLDPAGVVVGLRAKGRAIHDRSGFVRSS